jgi:hypothetical protein
VWRNRTVHNCDTVELGGRPDKRRVLLRFSSLGFAVFAAMPVLVMMEVVVVVVKPHIVALA